MTYPGSKEADVDLRKTPAGSSSGSAVAIAAGFSPLTIGTEANGSIVQPAIRAAAYGLKGTVDDVIMKGTQSGGAAFDSAGPIAKSAEDCADVMDILLPGRDFCSHLTKSWNGIRIAYLDYKTWQFPDSMCEKTPDFDIQHELEMLKALRKVESLGARVTYNAPLMSLPEINKKYKTVTMREIIKQPSQQVLENGLNDNMTDEQYHIGLAHLRQSVRHAVQMCLDESNADVIMASGETLLPRTAACAGYPIGSSDDLKEYVVDKNYGSKTYSTVSKKNLSIAQDQTYPTTITLYPSTFTNPQATANLGSNAP
ncbi:hypothetical protein PoHVEF18_006032 [Penicillium ochrochloron]